MLSLHQGLPINRDLKYVFFKIVNQFICVKYKKCYDIFNETWKNHKYIFISGKYFLHYFLRNRLFFKNCFIETKWVKIQLNFLCFKTFKTFSHFCVYHDLFHIAFIEKCCSLHCNSLTLVDNSLYKICKPNVCTCT